MNEVTATAIEAGEIELHNCGEVTKVSRAIVLQFDSIEDLKLALAATRRVRIEWQVPTGISEQNDER